MSICPDKVIISEYVDGELPSPWKEKLESHLAACPECNAKVVAYKKLNASLKGCGVSGFDYKTSFVKLQNKLSSTLYDKHLTAHESTVSRSFWRSSIRLPTPVLAAAVIALVFMPTFMFFNNAQTRTKAKQPQLVAYPVFQPAAGYKKNTDAKKNYYFTSNVNNSMRLYMPVSDTSNFVLLNLAPETFGVIECTNFFDNLEPLKTNDPQK